jgi:amidase
VPGAGGGLLRQAHQDEPGVGPGHVGDTLRNGLQLVEHAGTCRRRRSVRLPGGDSGSGGTIGTCGDELRVGQMFGGPPPHLSLCDGVGGEGPDVLEPGAGAYEDRENDGDVMFPQDLHRCSVGQRVEGLRDRPVHAALQGDDGPVDLTLPDQVQSLRRGGHRAVGDILRQVTGGRHIQDGLFGEGSTWAEIGHRLDVTHDTNLPGAGSVSDMNPPPPREGTADTRSTGSSNSTEAVSLRLTRLSARTGLSPEELGVARIYDGAHEDRREHGPLRGLDVLVKDLNRVAGEVTTFGSVGHAVVAKADDTAVTRLLEEGARLVGASVTAEFGATVYTEPAHGPGPVNPVDRRMTSGGSSSGAAVAVARGIVDVAHASDGGGSIRVPAAAVGLPGLKPAHTVDNGGLPNPAAQGFIARDLDLTARAYGISAPSTPSAPTRPLRLGHTNRPFHTATAVEPTVANATAAAASLLVTHPAVSGVRPVAAPYPVERFDVYSRIMAARCRDLPDPVTMMPTWLRRRGRALTPAEIADATDAVSALPGDVLRAWDGDPAGPVDVVVTPMLACAPPGIGAFARMSRQEAPGVVDPAADFLAQTAWTPWATLWNLTGWAGLSVPLVTPDAAPGRWPVSVHLGAVADRVSAAELLGLAQHLQETVARMVDADPSVLDAVTVADPGDLEALIEDASRDRR